MRSEGSSLSVEKITTLGELLSDNKLYYISAENSGAYLTVPLSTGKGGEDPRVKMSKLLLIDLLNASGIEPLRTNGNGELLIVDLTQAQTIHTVQAFLFSKRKVVGWMVENGFDPEPVHTAFQPFELNELDES